MKNKGIKVKHHKRRKFKPKRKGSKVFGSVIWVTAICVALFFGYSVLAPFIDWLRTKEPYEPNENLPPVITTITETTVAVDSAGSVTPAAAPFAKGYYLSVADLKSKETLTAALSAIPKGAVNVTVPLKSAGGGINYLTENETAVIAHAVSGTLALSDIYETVKNAGFTPIAELNLLSDNIYPKTFVDTSYYLGSGSRWYDNNPDNGGKPWLSPYSAGTKTYLTALSSEIAGAGFKDIILAGAEFPPFRDSDLNIVSSPVKSADRYTVILDIVSDIQTIVGENATVAVNANKIFNGKEDIFRADIADIEYRVVFDLSQKVTEIENFAEMSLADRFRAEIEYIKSNYDGAAFSAVLVRDGLTDDDIVACEDIAKQMVLTNLIIR